MKVELKLCKKKDKKIIAGLCQFYFYDLDTNSKLANIHYENGQYDQMAYFDNYWDEKDRLPYLIYKNSTPVGFALVHDITVNPQADWKIAEFFIMAPYRYQGVGKQAVEWLFKKYHGLWEVSVLKDNGIALKFWNKLLDNPAPLTHEDFQNYIFFEVLK